MGLFSKLFGKSEPSDQWGEQPLRRENEGVALAFLCLKSATLPNPEQTEAELCKWLKCSELSEFSMERKDDSLSISWSSDHGPIIAMMIAAPIPADDIQYAAANSFHWPEAANEMEKMQAHFIITSMGNYPSRLEQMLDLSRAIAALSVVFDSAGVYWGNARIVHPPEFFQEMIKDADVSKGESIPTLAWVGFLLEQNPKGGFNLYTSGLADFGILEMEIVGSKREVSDAIDLVSGVATYLLHSGNVIKDGQTVGGTEEEKIPVRYAKSQIEHPEPVLRLEY